MFIAVSAGKCDRGTFLMSVPHPTPPVLTTFGANKAEAKISIFPSGFCSLDSLDLDLTLHFAIQP